MGEDKPSKADEQTRPKTDEQTKFKILKFFMDYNGRYHDHKETMAWVITAFYIVGAISMALEVRCIAFSNCSLRVFFSVFFALAGAIALFLVWWQFQKRYKANERVNKCHEGLRNMEIVKQAGIDWASEPPSEPRITEKLSLFAITVVMGVAITLVNWY